MTTTAVEEKKEKTTKTPGKAAGAKKATGTAVTTGKKRGPKNMTDEHKARLARGRELSRIVGNYLTALETHKPKRGRKVTKETREARLAAIDDKLAEANAIQRLRLLQERLDLRKDLESTEEEFDITAMEAEFVKVAHEYATKAKPPITRKAFIELGVPADVLKKAGV